MRFFIFLYKMAFRQTSKNRPIALKQNFVPNVQFITNPITQIARPNIPNLQMTAGPYYINDNLVYGMSYKNIFQPEFDQASTKYILVSIKFYSLCNL